jgi:hypothetical protein
MGGWADAEAVAEQASVTLCHSVGYLLKKNDDVVILVQNQNDINRMSDAISIPAGCVVRVKRLK